MPTQLFLTSFLNHLFAAPVDKLLALVHVVPQYPEAPLTNAFAMELLVFVILMAYFIAVRVSLSVESPGAVQHIAEMTNEFVSDQGAQIIGHGSEQFTGYLTVLFLFILLSNLLGLVSPWLESPTASLAVPARGSPWARRGPAFGERCCRRRRIRTGRPRQPKERLLNGSGEHATHC